MMLVKSVYCILSSFALSIFNTLIAFRFKLQILSREPTLLTAAIMLAEPLNYNQRSIYHFLIEATVILTLNCLFVCRFIVIFSLLYLNTGWCTQITNKC